MLSTAQNDSFQSSNAGFSIAHGRDQAEFRDRDVLGLRIQTRRQADLLGHLTLQESLHVRVRDGQGERWVSLVAEVGPWDPDPLGELRERLLCDLVQRGCETLGRGEDLAGPGWTLSLMQFRDLVSGRVCPPQEISAVRWQNNHLCVVHENESEPFARYDREAENTVLLYRLFEQLLDGVCQESDAAGAHGLGALRAQVDATEVRPWRPARVALVASVPIAAMVYALPTSLAATGTMLLLLLFLVVLPLLNGTTARLGLYEHAIVWSYGSDEVVLLLEQLTSFSVVHTAKPREDGTDQPRLLLQCATGHAAHRSVQFRSLITPDNRETLESMVIDVATAMASRMRETLQQSGQVAWTEQFAICDDALLCRPTPESPVQRIPRAEIEGWALSDAKLTMSLPNGDAISLATSCSNFYPGLVLLHERGWFKPQREV